MKKNNEKLTKQDLFRPLDFIVYAVIAVLTLTLFIVFVFPKCAKELDNIKICYKGELIYTYSFDEKKGVIQNGFDKIITEYDKDEKHYIKITLQEGGNLLEIGERYAKMIEADCSYHADCVKMCGTIEKGGDIIVCMPHSITVSGAGGGDYDKVVL